MGLHFVSKRNTCLLPILPPRNLKAQTKVNPQIGDYTEIGFYKDRF